MKNKIVLLSGLFLASVGLSCTRQNQDATRSDRAGSLDKSATPGENHTSPNPSPDSTQNTLGDNGAPGGANSPAQPQPSSGAGTPASPQNTESQGTQNNSGSFSTQQPDSGPQDPGDQAPSQGSSDQTDPRYTNGGTGPQGNGSPAGNL